MCVCWLKQGLPLPSLSFSHSDRLCELSRDFALLVRNGRRVGQGWAENMAGCKRFEHIFHLILITAFSYWCFYL